MAGEEKKTVVLDEERLIDDAQHDLDGVEDEVPADAIRRRLDRQLGLLKALPRGWRVARRESGRVRAFYVEDPAGVRASATVALDDESRPCVEWAPSGGRGAGDAWAHGLATLFAALDAEARMDVDAQEVV